MSPDDEIIMLGLPPLVRKGKRRRQPIVDMTGLTFGRLTAIRYVGRSRWLCQCRCGAIAEVDGGSMRIGTTKSCGCLLKEARRNNEHNKKHGMRGTSTYHIWTSMKQRCYNEKAINYHNYGGRGIKVCDRWLNSFENFLSDMGERPEGKSLDRYPDNDGNYEPGNCRWASSKTQCRNRRNNVVNPQIVREIRASDRPLKHFTKKYGLLYGTAWLIRKNKIWVDV
jgi:hypothetical protein